MVVTERIPVTCLEVPLGGSGAAGSMRCRRHLGVSRVPLKLGCG